MKTILVVEDAHIETAMQALIDSNYNFLFAETYEQAEKILDGEEIDGVITDLFFPSETEWARYWTRELVSSKIYQGLTDEEQGRVAEINFLTENPSGLAVAKRCIEGDVPFILVTAGNRHRGNLAMVRNALPCLRPFSFHDQMGWKDSVYNDPLPTMVLGGGVTDPPKDQDSTWKEALEKLKSKMKA